MQNLYSWEKLIRDVRFEQNKATQRANEVLRTQLDLEDKIIKAILSKRNGDKQRAALLKSLAEATAALGRGELDVARRLTTETDKQLDLDRKRTREAKKRLENIRKIRKDRNARRREDLFLGAGFPLLFGGGPGSIIGGAAGSIFDLFGKKSGVTGNGGFGTNHRLRPRSNP